MINAPEIAGSTAEERRAFIKTKYPCIADCDMCGLCKVFRGKDAEHAYADYISGKRTYADVMCRRITDGDEADWKFLTEVKGEIC